MTDKQKQYYKGKLAEFLTNELKIDINKPFICLNPEHPDHSPSMNYDKNRNKIHCFACGVDWDIFDLVGALYGISDTKAVFEKVENIIKGTPEGYKEVEEMKEKIHQKTEQAQEKRPEREEKPQELLMEYYKKCNRNLDKTDYLQRRGISRETANKFLLGYDAHFKGREGQMWGALIIPTTQYTYTARNTDMTADSKDRVKKHGKANVFNFVSLKRAEKPIFIVEGEFDALSFEEIGANAVALGGVSNIRQLVEEVKKVREETGDFNNFLLLALDNDNAGEMATAKLKEELDKEKIENYVLNDFYGAYKDANDFLIADNQGLIEAVQKAYNIKEILKQKELEEYKKTSNREYLQYFINGIGQSVDTAYIPTGFKKLDDILDGGLYEGLYICGAISSLGKTTLITQIADQIADNGQDVLIFSLEMARNEIIAKSISRETLLYCRDYKIQRGKAKTTRGITTAKRWENYDNEEKKIIFEALETYGAYSENIYIFEGMGDIGVNEIKKTIEKHIQITGKKPVVVIDYIQILAPIDIKASDKQNMDKTVLELKRMTRDFKISIIGISALNRASYKDAIGMDAFKESGAIEYGSDVLIGLQLKGAGDRNFNVDEAKARNPREIELVILKNRNGATGKKLDYEYYPLFNYFDEK